MIILPTRGRPESIRRFMSAYEATGAEEPVMLLVDHDDPSYDTLAMHPKFSIKKMPPHSGIGDCFNHAFKDFPSEEYYGIVADDVVPQTPGWDQLLKAACLPYGMSWGNDGVQGGNLCTHPFIAGDVVRRIGWLAAPGIKHWFVDNVWKDIAGVLGGGNYLPDVKMTHYHVLNGLAEMDDTYLSQPSREKDLQSFIAFRQTSFPEIARRIQSGRPAKP